MSEFKVGDKVQFTLEEAVKLEIKGTTEDPINMVYIIDDIITSSGKISMRGYADSRFWVSDVKPEQLIKVEWEELRRIERTPEKRPSKDDYYLGIAKQVASRSTCLRRKYGAIIVKDDAIVSTGYNGSPRSEHNCSDSGLCVRQVTTCAALFMQSRMQSLTRPGRERRFWAELSICMATTVYRRRPSMPLPVLSADE